MAQPSRPPGLLTPPPKLIISKCTVSKRAVIGVLRPNKSYYLYDFDSNKSQLIPHICSCQLKVTEADLKPLYSERHKGTSSTVIFVYNQVSNKVEQYVCRDEMYRLEQVENTGLVFNPSAVSQSNTIAILRGHRTNEFVVVEKDSNGKLRKCLDEGGRISQLGPREVITVIGKQVKKIEENRVREDGNRYEKEEDSDYSDYGDYYEEDEEDQEYYNHIDSLPQFNLTVSRNTQVVYAFNYLSKDYETFCYDEKTGDFLPIDCFPDPKHVVESHLYPKYVELDSNKKTIIHVYNSFNRKMEKYWFDLKNNCFEQVSYPKLVYDPSKNTTANTVCLCFHQQRVIILMRDSEGRMKKEEHCSVKQRFVPMPPSTVKTFIEKRKKQDEEKKKKRKRTYSDDSSARSSPKRKEITPSPESWATLENEVSGIDLENEDPKESDPVDSSKKQ
uniref:Uncharacterized protein n=1 Tax=Caenorhabditis tropicalis TaxID=1561998 RepID=A0A1I7UNT8_9PELO